jgi:hypothetical protein
MVFLSCFPSDLIGLSNFASVLIILSSGENEGGIEKASLNIFEQSGRSEWTTPPSQHGGTAAVRRPLYSLKIGRMAGWLGCTGGL